jgi:hypothetical protein
MNLRALAFTTLAGLCLVACQPLAQRADATKSAAEAGTPVAAKRTVTSPVAAPDRGAMATAAVTATRAVTGPVAVTNTARAGVAAVAAQAAPKSGDPLTAMETERATALALGSPELAVLTNSALDRDAVASTSVSELHTLTDRPSYRVLYTERSPDKTGQVRAADVSVYRYDTDQAAVSTVNLTDGTVAAQRLPEGYMPPLVPEEINEAAVVAKADPRVVAALRAAGLDVAAAGANAVLTRGLAPGSPCATHRCVKVFFSGVTSPVPTFETVVDLSALNVVEVLSFPETSGSDNQ